MAICKQDCDFTALIASGYTNNSYEFYKMLSKSLPAVVAATCGKTTPSTTSPSVQSILSSLGKISLTKIMSNYIK